MPLSFEHIYAHEAQRYDRLVSREDQRGNLFAALDEIAPFSGLHVADLGAGTGRVTRLLALLAREVVALDASRHMLSEAHARLEESGLTNWRLIQATNEALPLADASVDLAVEGWSFGHAVDWYPDRWREVVDQMVSEARRILRPGGTLVLIETLGTGSKQPQPPTEGLAALYRRWEAQGFQHRWIRTDYQFESLDEADELTRFFFGDALADRVRREGLLILPECTGLWWQRVE
ncbi:methyltransferase domain-containing protein [Aggregatilineales bacterium SYSU G02658]